MPEVVARSALKIHCLAWLASMLREDCVSNQGLEQTSETDGGEDSGQNAPEVSAPALGGESSPPDDDRPRADDRDPHVCKEWPCPVCHKTRELLQKKIWSCAATFSPTSGEPASTRTTIFRFDPESRNMEQFESAYD